MKVQEILDGLAAAAQVMANTSKEPLVKASANGAAVLISLVGRVLEGRTPDEAQAVLESLLKDGVKPITQNELDEQAEKIIADITNEK